MTFKKFLLLLSLVCAADAHAANTIAFSVQSISPANAPTLTWDASAWASTCTATGSWGGTKATAGTETLPAVTAASTFGITCTAPAANSTVISWTAPTTNTDGSALTDLAGFNVYSGATTLTKLAQVTSPTTLNYTASNQPAGTIQFAVTAYNSANAESVKSASVSKTFTAASSVNAAPVTVAAPVVPTVPNPPVIIGSNPPPPSGGVYDTTHTYTLPTVRPFISLNQFAGSATSAAGVRLKGQVDDVVTATNVATNNTYAKLVTALNSNHYSFSPVDSVVMYKLTGNTAYIDQAIRMVDLFVTSENALITAGSTPTIAGDSYLAVGDRMAELALAYDYGYSRLTVAQRAAWVSFGNQTISNVWNYNTASWGGVSKPWTGWATSDPGDNYYYSFLKATQLWSLATQNPSWITFLQTQKYTQLVPYFAVLPGGGSREGTGYGTSLMSLFENYAYWKDSTGEDLSAYSTHALNTIDYWVYATVPTFQYFAPIGDQSRSSMPIVFDYQRRLVLEGVALNPASAQAQRGLWWLARAQVTDGGTGWLTGQMRYNFDYRYDLLAGTGTALAPTALSYDATGTGALFARSDWTTTASWLAINAGPYDQSHAHQDQGGFSFFHNGWLSLTSNVYSNSGINQDTGVENVLRFDVGTTPVKQANSVSTKTVSESADQLIVNADLSPAYATSGKVTSWTRKFTYQRSANSLDVHDHCTVASGVTPVFQLHLPVKPVLQAGGSYLAGKLKIVPLIPATPTVAIVDMKTVSSDFTGGFRMELRAPTCEFEVSLQAQP